MSRRVGEMNSPGKIMWRSTAVAGKEDQSVASVSVSASFPQACDICHCFPLSTYSTFVILSGVEESLPAPGPMQRRSYCAYIMGSLSGTLYIGVTGNLLKRVFEHKFHRYEGFTAKYEVERLLYWESYDDVYKAIGREKQLKGWSRAKKIALFEPANPHWLDLAEGLVSMDEGW